MPKGQRPRGAIPRPRSGAAAKSARLRWHRNCREELPSVPGQGGAAKSSRLWQHSSSLEGLPHDGGQGRSPGGATQLEARGGGREELPHAQGAMAALAQEGLEELLHVQGQERHQRGYIPRPR